MAGGITQIQTGLDEADQFLQKPEAIAAGERLAQSFPAGAADPAYVMTRGDAGSGRHGGARRRGRRHREGGRLGQRRHARSTS